MCGDSGVLSGAEVLWRFAFAAAAGFVLLKIRGEKRAGYQKTYSLYTAVYLMIMNGTFYGRLD